MDGTKVWCLVVFGYLCLSCDPPPESVPTSELPDWELSTVWGALWYYYVDELGYAVSLTTRVHPGDTVATCGLKRYYSSGDSYYNEYDLDVETFVYDAQGFYLVLSSDDLSFEVDASYLPPDPDDPYFLSTEGEMIMRYGPFKETVPVGTDPTSEALWDISYSYP